MRHLVGLAAALALAACAAGEEAPVDAAAADRALVLEYADFGPAALSHTLVGDEWYQWVTPGCLAIHDHFEVQVVVFDGDRGAIERAYPTVPGVSDVRLVARADAAAYLDDNIEWLAGETDMTPLEDSVRLRLESTRARIAAAFP